MSHILIFVLLLYYIGRWPSANEEYWVLGSTPSRTTFVASVDNTTATVSRLTGESDGTTQHRDGIADEDEEIFALMPADENENNSNNNSNIVAEDKETEEKDCCYDNFDTDNDGCIRIGYSDNSTIRRAVPRIRPRLRHLLLVIPTLC